MLSQMVITEERQTIGRRGVTETGSPITAAPPSNADCPFGLECAYRLSEVVCGPAPPESKVQATLVANRFLQWNSTQMETRAVQQ